MKGLEGKLENFYGKFSRTFNLIKALTLSKEEFDVFIFKSSYNNASISIGN